MGKSGFSDLLKSKDLNNNRLSVLTGIPVMTCHDLVSGKTEFKSIAVERAYKIAKVLNMSIEDIYKHLEENSLGGKE